MAENIRFCPLASGSSGNCVYVGLGNRNFLIDAGISGKRIQQSMARMKLPPVDGIFVTHEHSDHIKSVGVLARRFNIPVYAAPLTWRYVLRHKTIGPVPEELAVHIEPGQAADIGGVNVNAFAVPHDASQPVGYSFTVNGLKVTVATDIGHATEDLKLNLHGSHILLLESNHDTDMLKNGRYPRDLKERVAGTRGHLSNAAAGALLAEIAHEKLHYAFLGHLSEENNRPLLAMDTVLRILEANKIKLPNIYVAERHEPSEMVEL
jgi:phosphoribosyl 1,2-cyclic phosphodiesterase